jgi:hypothetical protein
MKKTKIIIPALAMLAMSTAATVTGTVAWFSMNKTVTAEGMVLSAQGSGSIIITKWVDDGNKNYGLPKAEDRSTGVYLDSTAHAFFPSTHIKSYDDDAFSGGTHNYSTGLKYVTNGGDINRETGTARTQETTLAYETASGQTYFVDYDVFIAGDRQAFTNETVNVSLTATWIGNPSDPNNPSTMPNIMNALSVDFYGAPTSGTGAAVDAKLCALVNADTYLGTLSVAGKYNNTNHSSVAITNGTISKLAQRIPMAETNNSKGVAGYAVKMRAYFDGALIENGPATGTNANTSLIKCGSGEEAPYSATTRGGYTTGNFEYFYNQQGYIIESVDAGGTTDSVSDYYVVDYANSTRTYARTSDILNVGNVGIAVKFSLVTPNA